MNVSLLDPNLKNVPKIAYLRWEPLRYSWSCIGGPKTATINVYGQDIYSINRLPGLLKYQVEISDGLDVRWWGYIDTIDIFTPGLQIAVNLANMWNSIVVQYTSNSQSKMTGPGTHALSVSTYGTKEIIVSGSDIDTPTAANTMRHNLVEYYGLPRVERTPTSNTEIYATITCSGWWNTLDWKYYTNTGTDNVETTAQIADIVTASGQFLTKTQIIDASGISILETRDGNSRAGLEIEKLLTIGVSDGNRLKAKVTRDKILRVESEPSIYAKDYRYTNGSLFDEHGYHIKPSYCMVGNWVVATSPTAGQSSIANLNDPGRFFVEEAEYDVRSNTWTPTPRGSYKPGGLL